MRRLLTLALLLALLPVARSQEAAPEKKPEPGPYEGWTKEQFAADREAREREVRKRVTEYLTVRSEMLRTCSKCAGSGNRRLTDLGGGRTIMCLTCFGSGQRMRDDFDPERIIGFHFGPGRPEMDMIRHTITKGLKGNGIFAILLPVKRFEIREIRIDGGLAVAMAIVRRGNMPGGAVKTDRVDVTQWLRQEGKWWLVDPLLRIGVDKSSPLPAVTRYPEAERVRPRHEPEALALVEKAAARFAPLAGSDGRVATFAAKVRPKGSKRDARYRVTIDGSRHIDVEETAFPKSGFKDAQAYALAQGRWRGRVDVVLSRVVAEPIVPAPEDYHLRMDEGSVVGHGFYPAWILQRFVAEFGEDGRLGSIIWGDRRLDPGFVEKEDGLLLSTLETSAGDGRQLLEVTWKRSYEVWFPWKIVETVGEEKTTWRMSGFKVKAPPKEEPVSGDK